MEMMSSVDVLPVSVEGCWVCCSWSASRVNDTEAIAESRA